MSRNDFFDFLPQELGQLLALGKPPAHEFNSWIIDSKLTL